MAPFKVSTHTLFIYHCSSYEARNFSQSEARFSRGLAKVGLNLIEDKPVIWLKWLKDQMKITEKVFYENGMWIVGY